MKYSLFFMIAGLSLVGCGNKKEEVSQLASVCTYVDSYGYNYSSNSCTEARNQCEYMGYGGCRYLQPFDNGGSSSGGSSGWCTYVDSYGYNYGASTCTEARNQCESIGYGGCRIHPNS